MERLASNQ